MKLPASPFSGSAVGWARIEWAFMAALSTGVPSFGQLKGVETADCASSCRLGRSSTVLTKSFEKSQRVLYCETMSPPRTRWRGRPPSRYCTSPVFDHCLRWV